MMYNMFITRTSLYLCIFTAISNILVVVVVVVVAPPCWRGSLDDMWLTLILEHNQQQTRHDIWAEIWALKFEPIIFFQMGSTATTTICDDFTGRWAFQVYNPPRSFKDFSSSNLASTDVCCDCGGGVDCSDKPFETWPWEVGFLSVKV